MMNIVIIIHDDLTMNLWWNIIKNNSNQSLSKSVTTAPRFGTWGPIADAITVTSLTLAITVTPHSPTIVTTYTSHKNTKSPSLASGTNKIFLRYPPFNLTLMSDNQAFYVFNVHPTVWVIIYSVILAFKLFTKRDDHVPWTSFTSHPTLPWTWIQSWN